MMVEELIFDAEQQPLEFALVALDLLADSELSIEERGELGTVADGEGFSLSMGFGSQLSMTLDHDEERSTFTARVSRPAAELTESYFKQALSLNALMPEGRRFEFDNERQSLVLAEIWPAAGLQPDTLAAGMHMQLLSMHFLFPERAGNEGSGVRG